MERETGKSQLCICSCIAWAFFTSTGIVWIPVCVDFWHAQRTMLLLLCFDKPFCLGALL